MSKVNEAEEALYKRHGQLVDKMFLEGLTDEETAELEQIRGKLDEIHAPYYEPVTAQLRALKEVLEKKVKE